MPLRACKSSASYPNAPFTFFKSLRGKKPPSGPVLRAAPLSRPNPAAARGATRLQAMSASTDTARAAPNPPEPTPPPAGQPNSQPQGRRRGPLPLAFTLGYKEAASQWWSGVSSLQAERKVLSYVPFLREAASGPAAGDAPTTTTTTNNNNNNNNNGNNKNNNSSSSSGSSNNTTDPFGSRVWRSTMVQLSGKNRALNEYSIEREREPVDENLVMLHGFGAGLGFFYKNFESLSRMPGWKLYALDLLGMGNSSRPCFKIKAKNPMDKIAEAESFFIDSLEEWRRLRKIERFTLLGHSLGGYLAVRYALKYPGHLNKLILASPVGMPEDSYAVNSAMPAPPESTVHNELTQDQDSIVRSADPARGKGAETVKKPQRRSVPIWAGWLWENVSLFSVIRASGPLGPRLVSSWTSARFKHLPSDEKEALHLYTYKLFTQRGSGEFALPYLLAPGAFARSPLIWRIQDVGRGVIPSQSLTDTAANDSDATSIASSSASPGSVADADTSGTPVAEASSSASAGAVVRRETGIPIVMIYGDHDWMDVTGGIAAEEKLKQRAVQALLHGTEEERQRENGTARVLIVSQAGHHLYIDNPEEFNEMVRKEMEETRAQGLKERMATRKREGGRHK